MGRYIQRSCGNCGHIIQHFRRDSNLLEIAKPYVICPKCNSIVIISNKKEFIMFNNFDYIRYFLWRILGAILEALLIGTMLTGIIYSIFKKINDVILTIIFIVLILSCLGYFLYLMIDIYKKEKKKSINRTNNKKYLNLLKKYKLVTDIDYNNQDNGKKTYECGNCHKTFNGDLKSCPHCGAKFI